MAPTTPLSEYKENKRQHTRQNLVKFPVYLYQETLQDLSVLQQVYGHQKSVMIRDALKRYIKDELPLAIKIQRERLISINTTD